MMYKSNKNKRHIYITSLFFHNIYIYIYIYIYTNINISI